MEILIRHSVSIFITIGILFPFILLNTVLILNKGYT